MNEAVNLVGEKLREANEEALAKHNYLQAMLTGFKIDLEKAEAEKVFLRNAGFEDPLPAYEKAFGNTGNSSEEFRKIENGVAVRFPDPEGRKDRSGRVIPHDLVVYGELATEIHSVDEALRLVWPQIAPVFDHVWAEPKGPSK